MSRGGLLARVALEFADSSGIHGIKYISKGGRHLIERVLWTFVVLSGLAGSIFMVINLWWRFSSNVTRTSVETNHYPTWRLPFPAATLCNANRIFYTNAEKLINSLKLPEHINKTEAMERLAMFQQLIHPIPHKTEGFNLKTAKEFQDLLESQNVSLRQMMMDLDQDCNVMLERCMWEGKIINCNEMFEKRKCYLGFCCSFNYRGVVENINEDGKKQLVSVQRRMEHTRFYSHRMGLTVLLNPDIENYFLSSLFSAGIRILVHKADDYPDSSSIEKILPVRSEVLLRITGESTHCTEAVRDLDPTTRGCVFPKERKLRYFPVYSANNCMTECRMNYSNQFCHCAPFYYHEVGEFRFCNLEDIPCLNHYYYTFRMRRVVTETNNETELKDSFVTCDCPNLCSDVSYDVQFSSGDFKATKYHRTPFFDGVNVTNRVVMHFYFGDHVSIRTRKDIVSSWNELLSSLGGIFNLFLGCSFLSMIEIVYFFTLRLFLHRNIQVDG